MGDFFEYEKSHGVKDIRDLMNFVATFLENPAIFFDLSQADRSKREKELDQALAPFKG